jgi:hypothetical protein
MVARGGFLNTPGVRRYYGTARAQVENGWRGANVILE